MIIAIRLLESLLWFLSYNRRKISDLPTVYFYCDISNTTMVHKKCLGSNMEAKEQPDKYWIVPHYFKIIIGNLQLVPQ